MRNGTGGAVFNSALYVNEIATALIPERKKRATAEHTVEKFTLDLVAGEVFAFFVFEIFAAVFHIAPRRANLFLNIIIILLFKKCNT